MRCLRQMQVRLLMARGTASLLGGNGGGDALSSTGFTVVDLCWVFPRVLIYRPQRARREFSIPLPWTRASTPECRVRRVRFFLRIPGSGLACCSLILSLGGFLAIFSGLIFFIRSATSTAGSSKHFTTCVPGFYLVVLQSAFGLRTFVTSSVVSLRGASPSVTFRMSSELSCVLVIFLCMAV